MYGANTSGKSNFCKALNFVKYFFINSNNLLESSPIMIDNFRFSDESANNPSEFGLIFVKDRIKYAYSFSCNKIEVVSERLYIYENDKLYLVFDRNNNKYKFNAYASALKPLISRNTKNKLFVCTAATWNFEKAKPIVDFIVNDMLISFS